MICIDLLNLFDVKWWSKFLPNVPSWPGNCSCPSAKVTSLIPRDASRGPWGHPLATQGRPTRSYPKRGSLSYESHDLWKVWDDNTKNWVKNTIPKRWMAEYQNTERWIWLAIKLCKLTFSDSSEAPKKRSTKAACHCWIIPCFQSCNCDIFARKTTSSQRKRRRRCLVWKPIWPKWNHWKQYIKSV